MAKNNSHVVVLFVYKRPKTTLQMLELVKQAGIKKVYLFADGPKTAEDKKHTDLVSIAIKTFIKDNKEIKVIPHSSNKNLGLKTNIIRGLDVVFSQEESAIILEDDCIPSLDFFRFTSAMLDKYQDESRVMSITGTSVGGITKTSYDFAKYQICWGWATWARAWGKYDRDLSLLNSTNWGKRSHLVWKHSSMRRYWQTMLRLVKVGQIDTWDFQWSFSHFLHSGLAIIPAINLVQNIGFDEMATNTKTWSPVAGMRAGSLEWPLRHPGQIIENQSLSDLIERKYYRNPVAFLGMLRQLFYYQLRRYATRH